MVAELGGTQTVSYTVRQPRLPLAPLVARCSSEIAMPHGFYYSGISQLARRLNMDRTLFVRWAREGGIPLFAADELACKTGAHPAEIWGAAWWESTPLEAVDGLASVHPKDTRSSSSNSQAVDGSVAV